MGSQWGKDKVYQRAVREGYRSRAAYKLIEIQERYGIIRENDTVVDLGAAPGGWLQVVRSLTRGQVIGVDLSEIPPLEDVTTIRADFRDPSVSDEIIRIAGEVGIVLSDAAPKLSGQRSYDQARAVGLGSDALEFAVRTLHPGGNLIIKSFQGEDFPELVADVRRHFYAVKVFRTRASRRGSAEVYIIARNFIGRETGAEGSV